MNVISIRLDMIDIGERLRAVDEDFVRLVAAGFEADGQRTPIEVRKPSHQGGKYRLIAGAHRIAAARSLGWKGVAGVVRNATAQEAELLEIDENLMRHELTPLDRSVFLARRKEIYQELHPETKRGGDRKSDQSDKLVALMFPSFGDGLAERLGVSDRTIERSVRRAKAIPLDVRRKISGTWLARSGSQLDQLARLQPALQRDVVDCPLFDELRDVAALVRSVTAEAAPEPPTSFERFLSVWRKADADSRQRIVEFVSKPGES